jgi:hypothetical protein
MPTKQNEIARNKENQAKHLFREKVPQKLTGTSRNAISGKVDIIGNPQKLPPYFFQPKILLSLSAPILVSAKN